MPFANVSDDRNYQSVGNWRSGLTATNIDHIFLIIMFFSSSIFPVR